MQVEWRQIDEFPRYSVGDIGQIRNDDTGRYMSLTANQRGIVNVGLMKGTVQYKRSVTILVADAFVDRPRDTSNRIKEAFDTPINLDGDRTNNNAWNILWRPRWFATKFFQQFGQAHSAINRPVEVIETGEIFETSFAAAMALGVLDREIAISIMTNNYVFPLNHRFRVVK
jgi:hypothetical protein